MRNFYITLVVALGLSVMAVVAPAQDALVPEIEPQAADAQTNTPTKLEAFDARTGTVIIKGVALIGSIPAQGGTVFVRSKESKDVNTGQKEYGIAIGLKEGNRPEDTTILDYDELGSLLNGIDFLIKINRGVTDMPGFSAGYTTRAGFRVAAYSSNSRSAGIQAVLQGSHANRTRILLAPDQLANFRSLVQQAKDNLDTLRAK